MTSVTFCAYDKPDGVGGPMSWIQRLAPQLAARGFNVRCLFILHWGNDGPALASLRAAGIECSAVSGMDHTEDRIRWIVTELRNNPPDIFIPNLVVAAYLAGRWVREAGIATIGVLHSDDDFYRALLSEFVAGRPEYRVSSVVSVSKELEEQARACAPRDVVVRRIPYGVTIPADSVRREPGTFRIAYSGRFAEEQKRISDVAAALCRATEQLTDVEAVMYGDGPDRSAVERVLAGHPLSHVQLAGQIASERMQSYFLRSDAVTLLSDYEGLPIALMEAMACGCVPICSDMRSGIPELVEHEVTGLIVSNRDSAFVEAVARLQSDEALWQTLSRNARALVAETFSDNRSADEWAELLSLVAASSESKRAIELPEKLVLPPVNATLASADLRIARIDRLTRAYRKGRMTLGRVKQRLAGSRKAAPVEEPLHLERAVIARVSGGLANQMICYKLGRYLADVKQAPLILDATSYGGKDGGGTRNFQLNNYPLNCERVVFEEATMKSAQSRYSIAAITREMVELPDPLKSVTEFVQQNSIVYCDLWVALKLRREADAHAEQEGVLAELTLDPGNLDAAARRLLDEITNAANPVAVHVRRGDFANHDGGLLLSADYYNRSIAHIEGQVSDPSFFVFSDDMIWCRSHLVSQHRLRFVDFHDDRAAYADLFLASQCRHFVLSNESTFSHQIVQLSEPHPDRIVLTSSRADLGPR